MQTHDINRKNIIFQELDHLTENKGCVQGDISTLFSFIHNSDIIVKDIWTEPVSSKRMKELNVPAFQIDILFLPNDEIAVYYDTTNPYFTKQRMGFVMLQRFLSQFSYVVFNFRFSDKLDTVEREVVQNHLNLILGLTIDSSDEVTSKESIREAEMLINETSLTFQINYALEHNDKELFMRATSDMSVLGLTYRN